MMKNKPLDPQQAKEKASEFIFNSEDWLTPNSYSENYEYPPKKSGVYLIVLPKINWKKKQVKYTILYVGSAKNLYIRYNKHEVFRLLTNIYGYVQFYFKLVDNFRAIEKELIKKIQPRFNTQWR